MLRLVDMTAITTIWGHSSDGRAPAWHAGGQRFESAWLHLIQLVISRVLKDTFVEASLLSLLVQACLYDSAL